MDKPVTRVIVIRNKQGLHARPASLFVKLANEFNAEIILVRENQRVEARSMMDLLTLGAGPGTELVLEARGDDAHEAVEALAQLVEVGFLAEDAEDEQSQVEESK
jgi:phosphotransferase system HPr (HPr) family protein